MRNAEEVAVFVRTIESFRKLRGTLAIALSVLSLLAIPSWGQQTPLCALEVWTDQKEYAPGQEIKVFLYIKVGDQEIRGARFVIGVHSPFGLSSSIQLEQEINLSRGFEWQGFLITLPKQTATGIYELIARLIDPASRSIYCEARTRFGIPSPWGQQPVSKTLIVTSPRTEFSGAFVIKLAAWLEAAFRTSVHVIFQEGLISSYRPGDFQAFDVIMYYGLDFNQPPIAAFVQDVLNAQAAQKKIVWLGYHLDSLPAEKLAEMGLAYDQLMTNQSPALLNYLDSNTAYELLNSDRAFVRVGGAGARARAAVDGRVLIASARAPNQSAENFYFVGFHPTAFLKPFGAYLVFLDILHEVYGLTRGKVALVRLEDIHPKLSTRDLLQASATLKAEGVPFSLALIPIYVKGRERVSINDDRTFRLGVKQALLDGGEVLVHGATHQFDDETGVDFEFWDEKTNQPIGGADYARERVRLALKEIELAGLLPHTVGWATPHFKASAEHYRVFEESFSLLAEPKQEFDLHLLPYPIETARSVYINPILGFVAGEAADADVARIIQQARLLAGLKHGAVAGFFFHPQFGLARLRLDHLRTLIRALKEQGWQFQSISKLVPQIRVQMPK